MPRATEALSVDGGGLGRRSSAARRRSSATSSSSSFYEDGRKYSSSILSGESDAVVAPASSSTPAAAPLPEGVVSAPAAAGRTSDRRLSGAGATGKDEFWSGSSYSEDEEDSSREGGTAYRTPRRRENING